MVRIVHVSAGGASVAAVVGISGMVSGVVWVIPATGIPIGVIPRMIPGVVPTIPAIPSAVPIGGVAVTPSPPRIIHAPIPRTAIPRVVPIGVIVEVHIVRAADAYARAG